MSEVNQENQDEVFIGVDFGRGESQNLEQPPANETENSELPKAFDESEKSDDLPENHSDGENNSDGNDFEEEDSEDEHPPNVKFVGKRMRLNKQTNEEHLVSIEAPRHVNDADDLIELPSSGEQKKGFYHPKANVLIALFPDDYKPFVPKGE